MVDVPAVFFYAATIALIVVCAFLAVFLYYLILAVRQVIAIAERVDRGRRKVGGFVSGARRVIGLAFALFR